MTAIEASILAKLWTEVIAKLPEAGERDKWTIALSISTGIHFEVLQERVIEKRWS